MTPSSKRPTQADVAALAGVSRGTVSLVLNRQSGHVPISRATRERVLAAARELGYSPNPVAQMLASGRNRIIGFFAFEGTFPYGQEDFHHPYLVGVEREACERDFDLLLFTRQDPGRSKHIYRNGMNSLRLADGTIFIGNDPDSEGLERLLAEGYPFVLIGRTRLPRGRIDAVVHEHLGAARRTTEHLLALGHRRLAFLADAVDAEYIADRLDGCRAAVAAAGSASLVEIGDAAAHDVDVLARRLRADGVSALVCADRRGLPAVRRLMSGGAFRVPDELSVAFLVTTEDEFYADATRVLLNRTQLGRIAFDRLVARIEGRVDRFEQIRVPCDFVVGRTTAPAP